VAGEITTPTRSFAEFNLTAETLASVDAMGYRAPTEVQAETVPRAKTFHSYLILAAALLFLGEIFTRRFLLGAA
jgi:superfamily II DNA/RNA helicase